MYAGSNHYDDKCADAMSQAADRLEELEKERDKLILAVADHVTARCELAAQNVAMRDALCAARRFIKNGIELGVIRMPDADCPDPAHNTLPTVEAALNIPNLASEVLKRRDAKASTHNAALTGAAKGD